MIYKASVSAKGGDGGNGVVSFRREAHVPSGGPDGGCGGRGGDVVFVGDDSTRDLRYFRKRIGLLKAGDGLNGAGRNSNGRSGKNLLLNVPVVSRVSEVSDGGSRVMGYLDKDGSELVVAIGGKSGLGNAHFRNSVNKEPLLAEAGGDGQIVSIEIETMICSDLLLLGGPNSGKSSLVKRLTKAKTVVADYPFSTTFPLQGVIPLESHPLVVLDTPAIVKGSSEGKALGLDFMVHSQLAGVVVYVVDIVDNPVTAFEDLLSEVTQHDSLILSKPSVIILSKSDLVNEYPRAEAAGERILSIANGVFDKGLGILKTSSVSGEGLDDLVNLARNGFTERKDLIAGLLEKYPVELRGEPEGAGPSAIRLEEGLYEVTHSKCLRLAAGSRLEDWDTLLQFRAFMVKSGVVKALYELGLKEGDSIRLCEKEFVWD